MVGIKLGLANAAACKTCAFPDILSLRPFYVFSGEVSKLHPSFNGVKSITYFFNLFFKTDTLWINML